MKRIQIGCTASLVFTYEGDPGQAKVFHRLRSEFPPQGKFFRRREEQKISELNGKTFLVGKVKVGYSFRF